MRLFTGSSLSPLLLLAFLCTSAGAQAPGDCQLTKTWEAPAAFRTDFGVATGDFDGDGRASVIVSDYSYPNAYLYDYESTGDNTFIQVWASGPRKQGIYGDLLASDLDGDGRGEILAAQYGYKLRMFESSGDNLYLERETAALMCGEGNLTGCPTVKRMIIADTDGDGRDNVLVVQNTYEEGWVGTLAILAHDGSQVYGKITPSALSGVSAGYFDDDRFMDIFVTGYHAQEYSLLWFEYDGTGYVFRTIDMEGIGVPRVNALADTDRDGRNELLVAGSHDSVMELAVLDSPSDDTAVVRETIPYPSTTNPMDLEVGYVWDGTYPEIVVATHNSGGTGQLFFFRYNGVKHTLICSTGSELSGDSIYDVDLTFLDGDSRADVVLSGAPAIILESLTDVVPPGPVQAGSRDHFPARSGGGAVE